MKLAEKLYLNGIDSFEKLLRVIDHSYDGIVLSDKDGKIIYAGKALERISGGKREDIYGKRIRDLLEEGLIINDKKDISSNVINMSHRTSTGVEVFITSVPVYDENGEFLCFIANYREMAELYDIQKKLEETKARNKSYYLELRELRNRLLNIEELVVKSKVMNMIIENLVKFSPTDAPVLITGESGVGKGVIAKLIHKMSNRKDGPFIQINCGAIPENLLEAELFGYESGAFTGASKSGKPGIFEVAQKGTILLDEIAEISPRLQVKLLKAIQDQEIYHLGGIKPVKLDVRIICATNRQIEEMVKDGTFRKDLYYRINVIPIRIPPLRERQEDIIPLACHFLDKYCKKYNKQKSFSSNACNYLLRYDWPGNVRELQNVIERLVITLDKKKISVPDLPEKMLNEFRKEYNYEDLKLKEARDRLEKNLIKESLKKSSSIREAARRLGINHSTLIKKMRKLNIENTISNQK